MKLAQLVAGAPGVKFSSPELSLEITSLCDDSRQAESGALFASLPSSSGTHTDRARYEAQALANGAVAVLRATEPRLAWAKICSNFYGRPADKLMMAGVTGTNGKTTSKELVNAVLSEKYKVLATKGNLNNHIGVPLTLLSIQPEHEIAIIEMGANHQGEIALLCSIAEPDYGMITNIGKAHLEGFGGYEGVIKTKNEMYQFIKQKGGKLFVNMDNPLLQKLSEGINKTTFGTSKDIDFTGKLVDCNPFVKLKCKAKSDTQSLDERPIITTQLIGNYNFENILAAACIGHYFEVSEEQIKTGLENYVPSNNRSQVMQTKNNLLLLDAYNANPSSMSAAIENFAQMNQANKMVILGDMLELGDDSSKEHDAIVNLLKKKNINTVLLVGPHFVEAGKKNQSKTFSNADEVVDYLKKNPVKDSTILIKGSRGIKLEKVVEAL